jgi:GNAT superfamily N-acetyltransferase
VSAEEIVIREYSPADRDHLIALAPRLTEGVAPWRDPAAVLTAVRGWISSSADTAAREDHAVYVALIGNQIAGFVTVMPRKHFTGQLDAYVGELVTAPGLERRGVARQLMAAAQRWAVDRGLAFLTLETGAANHGARSFYAALGFREEDVKLTRDLRTPLDERTCGTKNYPERSGVAAKNIVTDATSSGNG